MVDSESSTSTGVNPMSAACARTITSEIVTILITCYLYAILSQH